MLLLRETFIDVLILKQIGELSSGAASSWSSAMAPG